MAQTQNKLFEVTDRYGTKLSLVELVSGWKRELRIRIAGVEVTRSFPGSRERRESSSMPIKAPEELADFIDQLSTFLEDEKQKKCDFSLGPHGRGCGTLIRESGEPVIWQDLKGGYSSRYGFQVDEIALRELLAAAASYH